MRVKRGLWIILLAYVLITNIFNIPVKAEGKNIEVKYEIGFNGSYKVESWTPIKLSITNKGDNIDGNIEIQTPTTPGKYISYVKPLSVAKDATKEITINVPVAGSYSKYKIMIFNNKSKVYEEETTLSLGSNLMTMYIGIISDDFYSVSYVNKMPAPNGVSLSNKVIKLDEKNFPEDSEVLSAFNLLVINNFDTSKLNKNQYNTMKAWVNQGGILLIGTGNTSSKTFSIFKDSFIEGNSDGKVKKINTTEISDLASKGSNKVIQQFDAINLDIKDATDIIKEGDNSLVKLLSKGRGKIVITSFDLGVAPLVDWSSNTAFIENLLNNYVSANELFSGYKGGVNENQYLFNEVMNMFSEIPSPSTKSFSLILLIYIIVVAPLTYLILKKLDRRELMWAVVPALSIVFALIMYISGGSSRITKVTANALTTISLDKKGNMTSESYYGIFTPSKMKIKVSPEEDLKIKPMVERFYGDYSQNTTNMMELQAKVYNSNPSYVEYNNMSLLFSKLVAISNGIKKKASIEGEIYYEDNNSIRGTIKNLTQIDLEDCLILTPTQYINLGNINKGESKEITGNTESYNGNLYDVIYKNFGRNGAPPNMSNDKEWKEFIDKEQKRMIAEIIMRKDLREKINEVVLIGFSKSKVAPKIRVNDKEVASYERVVVSSTLDVNFIKDNKMYYPLGFVQGKLLPNTNLRYDEYSSRVFGTGTAEVLYEIDKRMSVEEIGVKIDNISGIAKIYYWNFKDNLWEEKKSDTLKSEELWKYLSSHNNIKIKIDLSTGGDSDLPKISARGSVK